MWSLIFGFVLGFGSAIVAAMFALKLLMQQQVKKNQKEMMLSREQLLLKYLGPEATKLAMDSELPAASVNPELSPSEAAKVAAAEYVASSGTAAQSQPVDQEVYVDGLMELCDDKGRWHKRWAVLRKGILAVFPVDEAKGDPDLLLMLDGCQIRLLSQDASSTASLATTSTSASSSAVSAPALSASSAGAASTALPTAASASPAPCHAPLSASTCGPTSVPSMPALPLELVGASTARELSLSTPTVPAVHLPDSPLLALHSDEAAATPRGRPTMEVARIQIGELRDKLRELEEKKRAASQLLKGKATVNERRLLALSEPPDATDSALPPGLGLPPCPPMNDAEPASASSKRHRKSASSSASSASVSASGLTSSGRTPLSDDEPKQLSKAEQKKLEAEKKKQQKRDAKHQRHHSLGGGEGSDELVVSDVVDSKEQKKLKSEQKKQEAARAKAQRREEKLHRAEEKKLASNVLLQLSQERQAIKKTLKQLESRGGNSDETSGLQASAFLDDDESSGDEATEQLVAAVAGDEAATDNDVTVVEISNHAQPFTFEMPVFGPDKERKEEKREKKKHKEAASGRALGLVGRPLVLLRLASRAQAERWLTELRAVSSAAAPLSEFQAFLPRYLSPLRTTQMGFEQCMWFNVLLSRYWVDVVNSSKTRQKAFEILYKKFLQIRRPSFLGLLTVQDLQLGDEVFTIGGIRLIRTPTPGEVVGQIDIVYNGGASLVITTEVIIGGKWKVGVYIFVKVLSLRGTLVIYGPPQPGSRISMSFESLPEVQFDVRLKLGNKKKLQITDYTKVRHFIISVLEKLLWKNVVVPNKITFCLPLPGQKLSLKTIRLASRRTREDRAMDFAAELAQLDRARKHLSDRS